MKFIWTKRQIELIFKKKLKNLIKFFVEKLIVKDSELRNIRKSKWNPNISII